MVFTLARQNNAVIASQCAHWRGNPPVENAVIANQSADWCGNPPVRGKMYQLLPYRVENTAIFGGNRYLVPFNGGIATPVCELARNDSKYSTNTNLSARSLGRARGGSYEFFLNFF